MIGLTFALVAAGAAPAAAEPDRTLLVDRGPGPSGAKAGGAGVAEDLTSDGRYAFFSTPSSLLLDDDDDNTDVYRRDLETGALLLVSRGPGLTGVNANGNSSTASVSADGRYVAFRSQATNLLPDGSSRSVHIYVRDLETGAVVLASRGAGADGKIAQSGSGELDGSGRYLVFISSTPGLAADDGTAGEDVFVRDLLEQTTELVSRRTGAGGTPSNESFGTSHPSISDDGRIVAWDSYDADLDPGDTDDRSDVFVRDRQTHVTTLVSPAAGQGTAGDGFSSAGSLSADGRYLSLSSQADNIHPEARPRSGHVVVRDLQTGAVELADRASGADGTVFLLSIEPQLSDDGRKVVFMSVGAAASYYEVYVRDLDADTTTLMSRADGPAGTPGNDASVFPRIAGNGRMVLFTSSATNLDPADADGQSNVYARGALRDPPGPPVLGAVLPAGPANDNAPRVTGSAPAGTTVTLHADAGCQGAPIGQGPAAELAGPGVRAAVPDDATTAIFARAVDDVGKVSACSAAGPVYVEDSTAPDAAIVSGPGGLTGDAAPQFAFAAAGAVAFECRLDDRAFAACVSPWRSAALGVGAHIFEVRATDAAGNTDPTPARHVFTVSECVNGTDDDRDGLTDAKDPRCAGDGLIEAPPDNPLLTCANARLVLTDVLAVGGRLRLAGVADRKLAGRTVTLRQGSRTLATAKVAADGSFARNGLQLPRDRSARFQATIGAVRSARLKLDRKTIDATARLEQGRAVLRGRVTVAARGGRVELLRLRLDCRGYDVVARGALPSSGRFRLRARPPAGVDVAVYRARIRIGRLTTFSLPRTVVLR